MKSALIAAEAIAIAALLYGAGMLVERAWLPLALAANVIVAKLAYDHFRRRPSAR